MKDLAKSFDENQMENIWIELATKNRKDNIVGVIYNPLKKHTNDFLESLKTAIDTCLTEDEIITIMEDFKINHLSLTEQMNTNSVLTLYNLHPANTKETTRILRTTSPLSDYIITDTLINSQYITGTLLSSDHLGHIAILEDVITMNQETRIRVTHNKTHYKISEVNHDLMRADSNHIFPTNSVNRQPNIIFRNFCEILQKHASRKITTLKQRMYLGLAKVAGQHCTRSKRRNEITEEIQMQID